MGLDLAEGQAHALHLDSCTLTTDDEIIALLSVIVEAGAGNFEFINCPIVPVERQKPLSINNLVMTIVIFLDRRISQKHEEICSDELYVLETPPPDICVDPNLRMFYDQSLEWLREGTQADQLAEKLGLEKDMVRLNFIYLRQLGFIRIAEGEEAESLLKRKLQVKLAEKKKIYRTTGEASDLIRRTGTLILRTGALTSLVASAKDPAEADTRRTPQFPTH